MEPSLLNLTRRTAQTVIGLFICGVGVTATIQPALGVSPWDVLHIGMAEKLGIRIGTAIIVTSCLVLLVGLALGVRPGFGTIADIVVVGGTVNALLALEFVGSAPSWLFIERLALFTGGVFTTGLGIAIYVGAHLGAGPRDGLMIALYHRLKWPISRARLGIEAGALVIGFLLGGPIGLGTVIWGLLIGPSAGLWFKLLRQRPPLPRIRVPSTYP